MTYPHQPVLVEKVLEFLNPQPDGIYMDGTAGSAGHSIRIGEKISDRGLLISLDRDPDAVDLSKQRLAHLGSRASVIKGNYADLDRIMINRGIKTLNGALLDLGLSNLSAGRIVTIINRKSIIRKYDISTGNGKAKTLANSRRYI